MKQAGITSSNSFAQESEDSEKCLEIKNIKSQFNFSDLDIKANICYGFLLKNKKDKLFEQNQKRWMFLISSRPLTDPEYEAKDSKLESSALPYFLKFDTLYYYTFNDEEDNSEPKGEISMR